MIFKHSKLFLCLLLLSSCSSFNKLAINSAGDLLYKASSSVESEGNIDMVRQALPANLALIEGLLSESRENVEILATLNKGYSGYAFAINETDLLIDLWENKSDEVNKTNALKNYSKAMNYGRRYLKLKNIEWNDIVAKASDAAAIMHLFDKNLSTSKMDLETVMFTAQSLGSMINLQKDNIALISELPIVKSMFDWVCMKNPSINYGMCDIFNATFEAGRPKMLGGNPEKGKDIFEKAIGKHPHNWLIRIAYIQYYLIPQSDEDGFKSQMENLKTISETFEKSLIYPSNGSIQDWNREERLKFYQALAVKRYQLLEKYKKNLF